MAKMVQVRILSVLADEQGHYVVDAELPNGRVARGVVVPANDDRAALALSVARAAVHQNFSHLTGLVEVDAGELLAAAEAGRAERAAEAPAAEAPPEEPTEQGKKASK